MSLPLKSTPGPWEPVNLLPSEGDSVAGSIARAIQSREADGTAQTAQLVVTGDRSLSIAFAGNGPDAYANASLIAAAPDLYEALQASTEYLQRLHDMFGAYHAGEELTERIAANQTALARARGEEPAR